MIRGLETSARRQDRQKVGGKLSLAQDSIMRTPLSTFLILLAFGGTSSIRAEDDELQKIVARAIKARTGEAKITPWAVHLELKSRFFSADKVIEDTGSIKLDGSTRAYVAIQTPDGEVISVVDGEKGWIRENKATRVMTEEELADAKEDLHTDWMMTLQPLLGKEIKLSSLASEKVGGSSAVGVRISQKGFRDVDLYFDRDTWLLVKKRIKRSGPDGKEIEYETVYEGFKDFDGVKSWTKFVVYRDGKKRLEAEVVEAKFLEKLPANTFSKP